MLLPALGFLAACICFGVIGLIVLSRNETISGSNLFVFVVTAMVSSVLVAAVYTLTAAKITAEPLHSIISFISLVAIVVGGTKGGLLGVSIVNRLAGTD
jgi:hypothetical protein